MKDVELKLVSELMKNSRRSDRELAKAIGASQPTVTRIRNKLEKEGYVKEYTMIPDFRKLGYELLALTLVRLRKDLGEKEVEKARKTARESVRKVGFGFLMLERGIGFEYDGAFLTLHESYSSYVEFVNWLRQFSFLEISGVDSFLINLADEVHYLPLTLSVLAQHVLTIKGKKETH
jgi:DNA-binding Lrp family transcriptional regulator